MSAGNAAVDLLMKVIRREEVAEQMTGRPGAPPSTGEKMIGNSWAGNAAAMKEELEDLIKELRDGKHRSPWHVLRKLMYWRANNDWHPDMFVSVCLLMFCERIARLDDRLQGGPYR